VSETNNASDTFDADVLIKAERWDDRQRE